MEEDRSIMIMTPMPRCQSRGSCKFGAGDYSYRSDSAGATREALRAG